MTIAALLAGACGTVGDRVGAPPLSLPSTMTTGTPPAKPPASSTSEPTVSTEAPIDTASEQEPAAEDDTGAIDGADGPFGRGPGPGPIAPPPPAGPLTDGSAGDGRAAIVVKVDNISDAWPQAGINHADVTFEILVEGVSRFAAVFNSEDAELVGPVRSARTSDINLLAMLERPCFAFSGGNETVVQLVDAAPLVDVSAEVAGGAYLRAADRVMPHNLMTATAPLRRACRGYGSPSPIFAYADEPDARGSEVAGVALQLGASAAQFRWDGPSARWLRFVDEHAQIDTEGVQVSPANVVVLETGYLPSPADQRSPEAQSIGTGEAWVLSGGMAVSGRWQRSSPTAPYDLRDDDGAPLSLRPGRTWVVLAPPGSAELLDR